MQAIDNFRRAHRLVEKALRLPPTATKTHTISPPPSHPTPPHHLLTCIHVHTSYALLQAIDNFRPAHRLVEKPLRLPVAEAARAGKLGVVVGGKLEAGALRPGTRVLIMPSRQEATVK